MQPICTTRTKWVILKDNIHAVICSGDMCNGQAGRTKADTTSEISSFMTRFLTSPKPAYTIIGNHDDNINWDGAYNVAGSFTNAISKADQYSLYIKPLNDKWSHLTAVTDKCYYYSDNTDFKIRIIGLDAYESPIADAGDGTIAPTVGVQYLSQGQLDWLYTTLQSVPDDYAVIVIIHAPFNVGYELGAYPQGQDLISSIINAYKNATSYTHNYTNATYPSLNTSKVFDFTAEAKKEFICYLTGHLHSLNFLTAEGFNDQNVINIPCLWMSESGPFLTGEPDNPPMVRGESDYLRASFITASVERTNKKLYVTIYGAYRDGDGKNTERVKILTY